MSKEKLTVEGVLESIKDECISREDITSFTEHQMFCIVLDRTKGSKILCDLIRQIRDEVLYDLWNKEETTSEKSKKIETVFKNYIGDSRSEKNKSPTEDNE